MKKSIIVLFGISFILMSFSRNADLNYGVSNLTDTYVNTQENPNQVRSLAAVLRGAVYVGRYVGQAVTQNSPALRYAVYTASTIILMNEDITNIDIEVNKSRKIFELG